MKRSLNIYFILLVLAFIIYPSAVIAQEDEEQIVYYQMEPLDDSLFIQIQELLFINPPDPKAEIIVDLRDPNNQTIAIKGALYPFLALPAELRARIITYPFKINLMEDVHYASVFTRVIEKIRFGKVLETPTKTQISPTLGYINPFMQMQGGERLGISLKQDVGISLGIGTPYSGPLETNFLEVNFHILGVRGGAFSHVDAMIEVLSDQNHNNLIFSGGYHISYVLPFGNFFEFGYMKATASINQTDSLKYFGPNAGTIVRDADSSIKYQARLIHDDQSFFNWEFRYPVSMLGSTRGKIYVGQFLDEWHAGFTFREMSLAGSTFDFSFDAMPYSKYREPQYTLNLLVQKIMEGWGFSAFGIGPSATLSTLDNGGFGFTKIFVNMRFKLGTSF